MRFVTWNGKVTPLISKDVTLFIASMHASKGDRHTYHPAQKNPIGQAISIRTKNQMIAHSTPFPLIANCMTRSRGYFLAVGSTLLDPAALIDSLPVWPVRKYLYGNVIQILILGIPPMRRMNIITSLYLFSKESTGYLNCVVCVQGVGEGRRAYFCLSLSPPVLFSTSPCLKNLIEIRLSKVSDFFSLKWPFWQNGGCKKNSNCEYANQDMLQHA